MNPKRSPAIASFFRRMAREGRLPADIPEWYEGRYELRSVDQSVLARLMTTAYEEGRAFEKRKADRAIERLGRHFDVSQAAAEKALDRTTEERDDLAAALGRAKPMIENARTFADLIADVQWLLHGILLVIPRKRLKAINLPDKSTLDALRRALEDLSPEPKKELPF